MGEGISLDIPAVTPRTIHQQMTTSTSVQIIVPQKLTISIPPTSLWIIIWWTGIQQLSLIETML